ncbi:MAG: MotA/TolQ/ExbB proton channel family protein [Bacteroidia bacterium]
MKKIFLSLALVVFASLVTLEVRAQDEGNEGAAVEEATAEGEETAAEGDEATAEGEAAEADSTATDSTEAAAAEEAEAKEEPKDEGTEMAAEPEVTELTGHAMIKQKFIEGDWKWMTPVLICLIAGLAIAIGRIIVLILSWINVRQFKNAIEVELKNGNVEKAKDIARNTRGPIASIYYQGLDRAQEGIDIVEKSVVSYGSVQMGVLEKGLVWISLFISLAPMLGFMGTVIGMIQAFDQIEAMGDIQPSAVAGGIKVALLTTVAGLIAAIILQIFYNLITSIVDGLVNKMEDASIDLIDMMIKYNIVKKD